MNNKINTLLLLAIAMFLGIIVFQSGQGTTAQTIVETDNPELVKLFNEDQAGRTPEKMSSKDFDFLAFAEGDFARRKRVLELYAQNALKTGGDYFHAAMILQHGEEPEDYLLAHELCVVAISKGEKRAKWLAAASEDRFLVKIGRPQRFGTQYSSGGVGKPLRLDPVDPTVTDELRKQMDVPTLTKAKEREVDRNSNKTKTEMIFFKSQSDK